MPWQLSQLRGYCLQVQPQSLNEIKKLEVAIEVVQQPLMMNRNSGPQQLF